MLALAARIEREREAEKRRRKAARRRRVLAPTTQAAYRRALTAFDAWLADREATDATAAEYLAQRVAAGYSLSTLSGITAAFDWRARTAGQPSPIGPASRRVLEQARRPSRSLNPLNPTT